jgi:hypothetical protein
MPPLGKCASGRLLLCSLRKELARFWKGLSIPETFARPKVNPLSFRELVIDSCELTDRGVVSQFTKPNFLANQGGTIGDQVLSSGMNFFSAPYRTPEDVPSSFAGVKPWDMYQFQSFVPGPPSLSSIRPQEAISKLPYQWTPQSLWQRFPAGAP